MPLFDPLIPSTLLILASGGASDICKMPKPAEINVSPQTQDVQIITTRSLADMQSQKIDTINPHSFGGISVMQGFAQGEIKMEADMKLDYEYVLGNRAVCLWYEQINVRFFINPYVYIAKEVHKDRCMGRAVMEHEMKHVNADKMIVNKYAQQVGQKIYDGLKARGFMVGPVKPEDAESVSKRMNETVSQIIEVEMKRLEIDRMDLQASIDTKEEYDRVANECPDFKVTEDMLGGTGSKSFGSRR